MGSQISPTPKGSSGPSDQEKRSRTSSSEFSEIVPTQFSSVAESQILSEPSEHDIRDFPDSGWRAWGVVLGSWCAMVATFGVANSTGTLQAWLTDHELLKHSDSQVSWIFSIWLALMFLGSVQVGPIFDTYGARCLMLPGSVVYVLSVFILAWCKSYYQFILGFSILGGLSASAIFNPSITVIGHWFLKRRALATGLAASGGAIGGILFPLSLDKCLNKYGFPWAVRIMGFEVLVLCGISLLLIKSRHLADHKPSNALIDVRSLLEKQFAALVTAVFLIEWAVFIPVNYLVSYALMRGLDRNQANQILAYLNVGSTVGRALPGWFADHYGAFNTMIVTSTTCGIMCLAVWLPAGHTLGGQIAFGVLFGFWSGSSISLTPVCVSRLSPTKDYGKRYGTCYFFASFSVLTGLPIAGALTGNQYLGLILFSGLVYICGGVFFALARYWGAGRKVIF